MLAPADLLAGLRRRGVDFFTGVPDSLLAPFCAQVEDDCTPQQHVIAANEGNAVALAAGFHLGSGRLAAVYLQNSGLGNAINPLTSLTDGEVYRIPLLLIVGWRGEPGVADEPQHVKQGRITPEQLRLLEIPYLLLDVGSALETVLDDAFALLAHLQTPVALLVRKGALGPYVAQRSAVRSASLGREDALREILALVRPDDAIVATTGKTSRELHELRLARGERPRDFLCVGNMGHTSSLALGVALGNPRRRVICLDGDGSLLMHLGALATIGAVCPPNLLHVLLNNGAHESVGGQPTVADGMDFAALAQATGYAAHRQVDSLAALQGCWPTLDTYAGPVLLEIVITQGGRADLGRPSGTPAENKRAFIEAIRD